MYKTHAKQNLVQHMKACKMNPNRKEYKCELCGKGGVLFVQKGASTQEEAA